MPFFNGTTGPDSLVGTSTDDTIYGGNGNDTLVGGPGADYLWGEAGSDFLDGGDGNDTLVADAGFDTLAAGAGDDRLFYNSSAISQTSATMHGGAGSDTISGGGAGDSLDGGDGNDQIFGGNGNDTLVGGLGTDYLQGEAGSDFLDGGDGNDTLVADAGFDTLEGGAGDDRLFYNSSAISQTSATMHGGAGSDTISGGGAGDRISGGDGNDALYGGNGNDTLAGMAGVDTLAGESGNDVYMLGDRFDRIYDDSGNDTAIISANWVKVPAFIEVRQYVDGALALPYWIDALVGNGGNWYSTLVASQRTLYYTFPNQLPAYDITPGHGTGYTAFSAAQIQRTQTALSYISSIVDLRFVQTPVAAAANTLTFAMNTQQSSGGYAQYPDDSFSGSDVFLNNTSYNQTLADGSYGALVLIHEIGHALGLKHPFSTPDADGSIPEAPYLTGREENTAWTVMSYNSNVAQYQARFSELDVAALQYLYGPSPTARAGDNTYLLAGNAPNLIWDGAGLDTLDASSLGTGATLYLEPGYWGYAGSTRGAQITDPGQVTINFGSNIENLIGTSFSDRLFGSDLNNRIVAGSGNDSVQAGSGDDTLSGGAGNDTLDGGAGIDTALFSGLRGNYQIVWSAGTSTFSVTSIAEGVDTLTGFESFSFADASYTAESLKGNTAPALTSVAALTGATEDLPYTITWAALAAAANASDPEGDAIAFRIQTLDAGTLTKGGVAVTPVATAITQGESLIWTPPANANGTLAAFQVRAFDGALTSGVNVPVSITVTPVNDAPVVASPIADQSTTAGSAFSFTVPASTFSDVDSESLTFSATLASGAELPGWLSFDALAHSFSGTPTAANLGTVGVRVTASDGSLSAADSFDLVVAPQPAPADDYPASVSTTGEVTVGGSASGNIEIVGDKDWFKVNLVAGSTYRFDLGGTESGQGTLGAGGVTPYLRLLNSDGSFLESNSGGVHDDPQLSYRPASSGTYYLEVGTVSDNGTGSYRVSASLKTSFTGTAGPDPFVSAAPDEQFEGLGGIDAVRLAGSIGQYRIEPIPTGYRVIDSVPGRNGTDTLSGIERLVFSDAKLALDLQRGDNAADAALLMQVLAPGLLNSPGTVGAVLGLMDAGQTLEQVFQLTLDAGLVHALAGSASAAAIARLATRNVLGLEPPEPIVDLMTSFMDGRLASYSAAQFLTEVAQLDLTAQQVGLIGLQQSGLIHA